MMKSDASLQAESVDAQNGAGATRRTITIALIAFLTLVDLFATQAILPPLAHAYGVTPAAMGLAVNASTFSMAAASLAIAMLSHRIDRRRGIVAALVLLSLPTLLLAVAPGLWSFAALRIMQGLLMASAFTLTLAYLGEQCSAAEAAAAFAAYVTGNVASNLFGRLMSAAIADHLGLAANFIIFAGLNLAGAVLAYSALRQVTPTAAAGTPTRLTGALETHLRNRALQADFIIGFCILFAFIGTFTFVNFVLAAPPFGVSTMLFGFIYLAFAPSIVTTLAAGGVVTRLGPRAAFLAGLTVAGVGLPLLLAPNLALVISGLALVAIGTFFAQAVATGFISRVASGDRGAANGIYLACYFFGGLVGTAVLGQIFDAFGWTACVIGIGVSLALAALIAARLKPMMMAE